MSPTILATIRSHIEQWGGLNAEDALELLSLVEGAGARVEYAIATYNEPMRADMPVEYVTFVDPPEADASVEVWTRVVAPWRAPA